MWSDRETEFRKRKKAIDNGYILKYPVKTRKEINKVNVLYALFLDLKNI